MIAYPFCAFAFAFGLINSAPASPVGAVPAIVPKAEATIDAICNHDVQHFYSNFCSFANLTTSTHHTLNGQVPNSVGMAYPFHGL